MTHRLAYYIYKLTRIVRRYVPPLMFVMLAWFLLYVLYFAYTMSDAPVAR